MTASLPAYALIPLPGEGPEDVVAGPDGMIYTGLRDGRVFAVTGGPSRARTWRGIHPLGSGGPGQTRDTSRYGDRAPI
jgi:hypothetical protein